MDEHKPDFKTVMQELASNYQPPNHPDDDVLIAYFTDTLPEKESEVLREHLADCPQCTQTLLALGTMPEGEPEDYPASPEMLEEGHNIWGKKLELEKGLAKPTAPLASYRFLQVAASFLLFTSLALAYLLFEKQSVIPPQEPVINIDIQDRLPENQNSRGPEDPKKELSWPEDKAMVLIFSANKHEPFSDYRLVISLATSRAIWQKDGFRADAFGNFTLALPSRFLSPGDYVFSLYGVDDGKTELLATYTDHRVTPAQGSR